jgi:hypothetical protein
MLNYWIAFGGERESLEWRVNLPMHSHDCPETDVTSAADSMTAGQNKNRPVREKRPPVPESEAWKPTQLDRYRFWRGTNEFCSVSR